MTRTQAIALIEIAISKIKTLAEIQRIDGPHEDVMEAIHTHHTAMVLGFVLDDIRDEKCWDAEPEGDHVSATA